MSLSVIKSRKSLFLFFAIVFVIVLLSVQLLRSQQQQVELSASIQSWISASKSLLQRPMATEFNSIQDLYQYFHWSNSSACEFAVDFGFQIINWNGISAPDGHKAVCLDSSVAPVYGKCLVYSFGIKNQWAFDESMEKFQCQVYSFDPSMGVNDHNRTDLIHFYNIGLGGEDDDALIVQNQIWKMRTLTSIYQMLRPMHGTIVIDVLKMDIEYSEWAAIPQMLTSGLLVEKVKQLAVEIHFKADDTMGTFRRYFNILRDLETAGFVRFSSRINPWLKRPIAIMDGKQDYIGFEMAWYNSKFY